ncbi:hypothetical protein UFOVP250_68 [uncultured Caudovirales phage]|uniref:Uncharacterized protein n=1 Tax=uncultured Caudovirales phage TaxID=2100421 RepID=A0A6J5LJR8_9CAUD|nr:hypothetical protein UFOVP250_68 [uncultured Caudovirales phage]
MKLIFDEWDDVWVWIEDNGSADEPMSPMFDDKASAIDWLTKWYEWMNSKPFKNGTLL